MVAYDSRFLIPLVESIPAVKGLAGRARKRPGKLHADRAYASRAHRAWLRSRGIAARIARYGVEVAREAWRVVERTHAWTERWRRTVMHHDCKLAVSAAWVWLSEARILLSRLAYRSQFRPHPLKRCHPNR